MHLCTSYPSSEFFHMSSHYRRIRSAKKVVDTSPPAGYRHRKPGHSPQKSPRGSSEEHNEGYPDHSRYLKKHDCLESPSKRSASTPRPPTRRNVEDMPVETASMRSQPSGPNQRSLRNSLSDLFAPKSSKAVQVSADLMGTGQGWEQAMTHRDDYRKKLDEHEYLQFSLRITEAIIRNDIYSNNDMRRVFKSHIEANKGRLSMDKMLLQIAALCHEINVPFDCSSSELVDADDAEIYYSIMKEQRKLDLVDVTRVSSDADLESIGVEKACRVPFNGSMSVMISCDELDVFSEKSSKKSPSSLPKVIANEYSKMPTDTCTCGERKCPTTMCYPIAEKVSSTDKVPHKERLFDAANDEPDDAPEIEENTSKHTVEQTRSTEMPPPLPSVSSALNSLPNKISTSSMSSAHIPATDRLQWEKGSGAAAAAAAAGSPCSCGCCCCSCQNEKCPSIEKVRQKEKLLLGQLQYSTDKNVASTQIAQDDFTVSTDEMFLRGKGRPSSKQSNACELEYVRLQGPVYVLKTELNLESMEGRCREQMGSQPSMLIASGSGNTSPHTKRCLMPHVALLLTDERAKDSLLMLHAKKSDSRRVSIANMHRVPSDTWSGGTLQDAKIRDSLTLPRDQRLAWMAQLQHAAPEKDQASQSSGLDGYRHLMADVCTGMRNVNKAPAECANRLMQGDDRDDDDNSCEEELPPERLAAAPFRLSTFYPSIGTQTCSADLLPLQIEVPPQHVLINAPPEQRVVTEVPQHVMIEEPALPLKPEPELETEAPRLPQVSTDMRQYFELLETKPEKTTEESLAAKHVVEINLDSTIEEPEPEEEPEIIEEVKMEEKAPPADEQQPPQLVSGDVPQLLTLFEESQVVKESAASAFPSNLKSKDGEDGVEKKVNVLNPDEPEVNKDRHLSFMATADDEKFTRVSLTSSSLDKHSFKEDNNFVADVPEPPPDDDKFYINLEEMSTTSKETPVEEEEEKNDMTGEDIVVADEEEMREVFEPRQETYKKSIMKEASLSSVDVSPTVLKSEVVQPPLNKSDHWMAMSSKDRIIERLTYVPVVSMTDSMEAQVRKVVLQVEKFRQVDGVQEHALKDVLNTELDDNVSLDIPAIQITPSKFVREGSKYRELIDNVEDTKKVLCFQVKTKKQPVVKNKPTAVSKKRQAKKSSITAEEEQDVQSSILSVHVKAASNDISLYNDYMNAERASSKTGLQTPAAEPPK